MDAVREYSKTAFPTSAVYGGTLQPALRLITCSDWDADTHAYRANTIVFAHLGPGQEARRGRGRR